MRLRTLILPTALAGVLSVAPVAAAAAPSTCEVPVEVASVRPGLETEPTEVKIGIYVVDVRKVHDPKQTVEVDFFLLLIWRDPRLDPAAPGASLVGCNLPLDAIWSPRVAIINGRQLHRHYPDRAQVAPGGELFYYQRFEGEITVPLDLVDFPFDRQRFDIRAVALGYGPETVAFVIDERRTGLAEKLSLADWTVESTNAELVPYYMPPQERNFSGMAFTVEIVRHRGYFLWKALVPLSLIVFMSWAVFWIHPRYLGPQVGISTSAVLTLIAFQFSLAYLLPALSYLTRADRFIMGSALLVFLAFGESLATAAMADKGKEELSQRIDRAARIVFPIAYVLVLAYAFWL